MRREHEQVNQALAWHFSVIHEMLQAFDDAPPSSLLKVSWDDVLKLGEQLSKQATAVGMLWTGDSPNVKMLEESMGSYFNTLQGVLLQSHGSKVNAGPTLSSSINASVKQVVDCSFNLFRESVSSYGTPRKGCKLSIPQQVGTIWESCSALKKVPRSNVAAIGRALARIGLSIKDVLREMNELKLDKSYAESVNDNGDGEDGGDLGDDLSNEEMMVAQLAKGVVSGALILQKELIRSITTLTKAEASNERNSLVTSMEKALDLSHQIGLQVDEVGASVYPPQEEEILRSAVVKIGELSEELKAEAISLQMDTESFHQAWHELRNSSRLLESGLFLPPTGLLPALQSLDLHN